MHMLGHEGEQVEGGTLNDRLFLSEAVGLYDSCVLGILRGGS